MKIVRILAVVLLACLLPVAANAAIIESVSVNVLDRGSFRADVGKYADCC